MLLTKEVEVKLWGNTVKYYNDRGYKGRHGDTIIVKIEDLPKQSSRLVSVQCEYCGSKKEIRYVDYCKSSSNDKKYACSNCAHVKASEIIYEKYGVLNYSSTKECREKVKSTLQLKYGISHVSESEEFLKRKRENNKVKYGVEHTFQVSEFREKGYETNYRLYGTKVASQNEEVQQKIKETTKERYNCIFASQNDEIKEKIRLTNRQKYGYDCVLQVPEIKDKISESIKNIYGVDNVSQAEVIKDKKRSTLFNNYGVLHPSKSPEILAKIHQTMYKNGTCPTSRQQLYIFNLCKQSNPTAELNYPISYYSIDICFPEEKLAIEIDFGGHDLSVKLGSITREQFQQKEIIRSQILKHQGYKTIRFISHDDKLPSDQTLLSLLSYARQYFSEYLNHSWIEFNFSTSSIRNAENKEGVFFDYGELRKIKQQDLDALNPDNSDTNIQESAQDFHIPNLENICDSPIQCTSISCN